MRKYIGGFLLFLNLSLLLAACSVPYDESVEMARDATAGRTVYITHDDPGGNIAARDAYINELNRRGMRVELTADYCASACTMFLGVEDMCVSPQTIFGFHGPAVQGFIGRVPLDGLSAYLSSQTIAGHYPQPLRRAFMARYRHIINGPMAEMRGEEMIARGWVEAC